MVRLHGARGGTRVGAARPTRRPPPPRPPPRPPSPLFPPRHALRRGGRELGRDHAAHRVADDVDGLPAEVVLPRVAGGGGRTRGGWGVDEKDTARIPGRATASRGKAPVAAGARAAPDVAAKGSWAGGGWAARPASSPPQLRPSNAPARLAVGRGGGARTPRARVARGRASAPPSPSPPRTNTASTSPAITRVLYAARRAGAPDAPQPRLSRTRRRGAPGRGGEGDTPPFSSARTSMPVSARIWGAHMACVAPMPAMRTRAARSGAGEDRPQEGLSSPKTR